jgi:hypothetical protein
MVGFLFKYHCTITLKQYLIMEAIQIITTPNEFKKEIANEVKSHLDDFLKHFTPQQPNEYLTRRQLADMFDVDISTISNWQRTGKLNPLGISGRVYFLRSEVEASLIPLNV